MQFSHHATIRMQQRAVREKVIELILVHGHQEKKEGHAVEVKISKKDRARLISDLKHEIRLLEKAGKKALLLSGEEDTVITVYSV
jgi:predicted Zn-ribbon and HTH transcriptional regulator